MKWVENAAGWRVKYRTPTVRDLSALGDIAGVDLDAQPDRAGEVVLALVKAWPMMVQKLRDPGGESVDPLDAPVDVMLELFPLHPSFRS